MNKRLFFNLNRANHTINKKINQTLLKKFGITFVQVGAVLFIENNKDTQLKDLSQGLDINNSAATTLVERLEKNKLITKKKSKYDKRAYCIELTPKGNEVTGKVKPLINEFNKIFEENFSDHELKIIFKFLKFSIDTFK